jgi:hypothetical protein
MDTIEDMLSMLLGGAVELLDIAPDLQQTAIGRYEEVGTWLTDHGEHGWQIYPQGSFRLGTVVRPSSGAGEYDIDLVCRLPIAKESTTQEKLKERVGGHLDDYVKWKHQLGHADGPTKCEPRRRCWTLCYPTLGFHLDVLPCVPDEDHLPTGILLTDKQLHSWQHSNPIGYAAWFRHRSEDLLRLLKEAAAKRNMSVADVPTWEVRSTLQRLVQVLKWHTMVSFATDPDNRPPSILITTLAARAYRGEQDLFTAARNALDGMTNYIENRDGTWWIPNPAHEEENFADKWNEYPERRQAFVGWLGNIRLLLDELVALEGKGLPVVASRLKEAFGVGPIERSVERLSTRYRELREGGTLRMGVSGLLAPTAAGPLVRDHQFYGRHPELGA